MTAIMVDVDEKPMVLRRATAAGRIRVSAATLDAIRERRIPKGDVLEVARTAAILAAKKTPELVPLSHPIPLEAVKVEFVFGKDFLDCRALVSARWKTGVEMEALAAVAVGLLTVWDLVKPLEKDAQGQYPHTRITDVRIEEKLKAAATPNDADS